jgi:hypothetical protein
MQPDIPAAVPMHMYIGRHATTFKNVGYQALLKYDGVASCTSCQTPSNKYLQGGVG